MLFNRKLAGWIAATILVAIFVKIQLPKQRFFDIKASINVVSLENVNNIEYQPNKMSHHKIEKMKKSHTTHQQDHDTTSQENAMTQASVDKDDRSDRSRAELELITKKLNEKYKYEGPGFGKSNFIGLESLSGALRGEKHNHSRKRRKEVND